MKKPAQCVILFLLVFLNFAAAQAQTPPVREQADDVVRVTTNLVQLDAVVTDKAGNPVTNLTAADFDVYQDGKLQKITNFTFVNRAAEPSAKPNVPANTGKDVQNATLSTRVGLENANRILTFIIDDGNCSASQLGMIAARGALEKFINNEMQPNDLVAIYQTRGGSSLLQQYTFDKARLMQTVRKIRWLPPALSCGGGIGGEIFEPARDDSTGKIQGQGSFESDSARKLRESREDMTRDNQTVGTFGVLRYAVRGLERIPGRKTVFFLSDGFSLRGRDNELLRAQEALRDLTEQANRAGAVFNTIDVRGIVDATGIGAEDDVLPENTIDPAKPSGTSRLVAERSNQIRETRNGLFFLANETGGRFYHGSNFLDVPIRRALNSEKGYYLLAYEPEDDTFQGKKFHRIEIKLKRPDLRVLSRAGFYGVKDEEKLRKPKTGDSELYDAIAAPLPVSNLNLQLSAFYGGSAKEGNFVRTLIHVAGSDITFVDAPDNKKKAVFDVVAVTLNEKNKIADQFNHTYTLHLSAEGLPSVKQNGLVYSVDVPVKKPGAYTFRVAMRDANSKQLGAASQLVEAPDLKKGKLFISGLALSAVDAAGKFAAPSVVKPENGFSLAASTAIPAIRLFKNSDVLAYSYQIYNAQIDKSASQPKLLAKINLYRDGQLFSEGKPQPVQLEPQTDSTRINDYGYLRLNQNTKSGSYVLQITITDAVTNQTASQWIDFEVMPQALYLK